MAWSDPATDKQLDALLWMLRNHTDSLESHKMRAEWLKQNRPTRKEISEEMGRVRDLCIRYKDLGHWDSSHKQELLNSEIWKNYKEVKDVF